MRSLGAIVVGLIFVMRYYLALRRIWQEVGQPQGFVLADSWRAMTLGAYGDEIEPNRRHAVRQAVTAMLLLAIGMVLAAWLLAAHLIGSLAGSGLAVQAVTIETGGGQSVSSRVLAA